jgi:hypothetical protein
MSTGFQPAANQSTLDYLMDICHEKALLSSLSTADGKRSSLLTAEDLANIRQSMDGSAALGSPRASFASDIASPVAAAGKKVVNEASVERLAAVANEDEDEDYSHLSTGPVVMRGDTPLGPSARVMLLRRTTLSFRNVSLANIKIRFSR